MIKKLILFCLLLFAPFSIMHSQTSKKTSLALNNVTLKEFFDTVEKKLGYTFMYSNQEVDENQRLTINTDNLDVTETLNKALNGRQISYAISGNQIVLKKMPGSVDTSATNEGKTISGIILDKDDIPVIGANVVIKGTSVGTVANANGEFTITVPGENTVLKITYIGYIPQEIIVEKKQTLTIRLEEDTQKLDEVVVVGYGVQKKSDLISAITTVKGKDLVEQPVPRVDQLLRGRVAGMQVVQANGTPGASTSIRIRGGNSLSASNEPLYVIDGFVDAGTLNSLNPNDIESIEILKDATSTAIYGARGSNGVILVTTKRGKEGALQLDVEASYGWQKLPKQMNLLSVQEYAEYQNIVAQVNKAPMPYENPSAVKGVNWQDELFQTAPVYNLNISASGGSKNIKFLLSVNHFDQEGIMIGSGFNRTTFRSNLDANVKPWFKLGTTTSLSREFYDISTMPSGYEGIVYGIGMSPVGLVYNADGSYNYTEPSRPTGRNPVAEALLPSSEQDVYNAFSNNYIQIDFNGHLTWRSTGGFKFIYSRNDYFSPKKDSYQELNNNASVSSSQILDLLTEHTLSYFNAWEKHNLTALGGFTAQKYEQQGLGAEVSNFPNDATGFYDLNAAQQRDKTTSGYKNAGYMSYLGRINYSYDNRYLLTLVGRYDGSSRFSEGNKWAFFPSVSVGWRISQESFMRFLSFINDLKLRTSYGRVGNQAIDIYATQFMFSSNSTIMGGKQLVTYTPSTVPNPDLTWEKTNQFDLGLDFSVWNHRISGQLDFYYKKTTDLLWSVSVPSYTGQSSQLQNLGSLSNKGIELALNANIINNKDLNWTANLNISTNRSKVLNMGPDEYKYVGDHWGGQFSSILKVGSPVGMFYGKVYEGVLTEADLATGNYSGRVGDPKYKKIEDDPNNSTIIGDANPDFYGGFGTTVNYKGIGLNVFFQYSYGNDVMNLNSAYLLPTAKNVNVYKDLAEKIWTPQNPNTDVARPANDYIYSVDSRFVEDGSFLRLSALTLSYDLPARWIQKAGLSTTRFYVTGNNLFNICDYRGFDPEVSLYSSSPILRGYDWGQYPMNRSVVIGLKITL